MKKDIVPDMGLDMVKFLESAVPFVLAMYTSCFSNDDFSRLFLIFVYAVWFTTHRKMRQPWFF